MIYSKSVQTIEVDAEPTPFMEDDLRQRVMRDRDREPDADALERELEAESIKLDEEIEQEIRGALSDRILLRLR